MTLAAVLAAALPIALAAGWMVSERTLSPGTLEPITATPVAAPIDDDAVPEGNIVETIGLDPILLATGEPAAPPEGELLPALDGNPAFAGAVRTSAARSPSVGQGAERAVRGGSSSFVPDTMLDPGVVASEIARRRSGLVACYERALRRKPYLAGTLEVRFTVGRDGAVRRAVIVRDTLGDARLADEVRAIFTTWRFPAPSGGAAHFSYPFTFRPRPAERTPSVS